MRTPWQIEDEVTEFAEVLHKANYSTTSVAFTVSSDEMKALAEHWQDPRRSNYFPVASLMYCGVLLVTSDRTT